MIIPLRIFSHEISGELEMWFVYGISFLSIVGGITTLLALSPSPEFLIRGDWQESAWAYEHEIQEKVGKTLQVHRAEEWSFLPAQKLQISRGKDRQTAKWRLAGRSNILLIQYDNGSAEHYNITQLSHDRLVLNFDSDIQSKGIAKLTFRKLGQVQ